MWLKKRGAKDYIDFVLSNWPKLKKTYKINGVPTIPVIWGFRNSFMAEMKGHTEGARKSRTHRETSSAETAVAGDWDA